jgi:hypothetical protein
LLLLPSASPRAKAPRMPSWYFCSCWGCNWSGAAYSQAGRVQERGL